LIAAALLILPFIILAVLIELLPPWGEKIPEPGSVTEPVLG
jgi:hypothetical protein